MASQNTTSYPFPSNAVPHPMNHSNTIRPLPHYLEAIIATVDANELVDLWTRMTPTLRDSILNALPRHYEGETNYFLPTMQTWFREIYGDHVGDNHGARIRQSLRTAQITIPSAMRNLIHGHNIATTRQLQLQYNAQAFLRGLLTDLLPHHAHLADAFVTALRPVQPVPTLMPTTTNPFAPQAPQAQSSIVAAPPPPQQQPSPPQQLQPAPATTPTVTIPPADSMDTTERYYWCPRCACKCSSAPGSFRNLHRHWFEGHARSNRSAVELKQKWDAGALGPWTADEAKEKSSGMLETDAKEEERKKKRKGATLWRQRMQKDPERWERVAQREEGYPSYAPGFVSLKRKKIRETKEKIEREKKKDEDGKGGNKGKKK